MQTYTVSFYAPTLVQQLGFTLGEANLLMIPSALVTFGYIIGITRLSDRTLLRSKLVVVSQLLASVGYAVLLIGDWYLDSSARWLLYIGLVFVSAFSNATIPLLAATITDPLESDSDMAMYMACMATIGNLGGVLGPQVYGVAGSAVPERNGAADYRRAHAFMGAVALLGAALAGWVDWRRGRRRDRGVSEEQAPLLTT